MEAERVPEPNSVGTSPKRGKVDSVLEFLLSLQLVQLMRCRGAEVTQLIVDTMAKTLQKSLQAIVKLEEC